MGGSFPKPNQAGMAEQAPAPAQTQVPTQAVPMQAPAPVQAPTQAVPMQAPAPVASAPVQAPAPTVPVSAPPQYTVEQVMEAGAALMDAGKMVELTNLLHSFGVQSVMDLRPEQLGAFATAMREMGAQI
ncbi:MAG: hypothetical protein R3Y55_03730 [Rikenellaceae bacterium]